MTGITYWSHVPWGESIYKAAHFNRTTNEDDQSTKYLYIEGDAENSELLKPWKGKEEQPDIKTKGRAKEKETKWIMDYALFPVLAQVEDTLLAFLKANDFHPSLGQVTIHMHWVPYYLR